MKDKKLSSFDKKVLIFVAVFLVAVYSFVAVINYTGDIVFLISEDTIQIKADYWSDYSIAFSDIDKIEYKQTDDKGKRKGGFGSPRLSMGSFRNDEYGDYIRYSYTKCKSGIIITKKDGDILVISMPLETETFDFYQNLKTII